MKKQWIDEKLRFLHKVIADFHRRPQNFFFEPTQRVYEKLESDNEEDLQAVTSQMAKHISIVPTPIAKYDWGIKMGLETAGKFSMTRSSRAIQIPFFYVGKKYSTGAILAHEMTHAFLAYRGITLEDTKENEVLTDITTIFIGLGKLLLNGFTIESDNLNDKIYSFGYLTPELSSYCYRIMSKKKLVPDEVMFKNLNPKAINMLELEM